MGALTHNGEVIGGGGGLPWVTHTVLAASWSSETVNNLGDGNDYYYYEISLSAVYTDIPRIELAASSGNEIPTSAEAKAFGCISKPKGWAICDSTNLKITLYAQTKPVTDFVIKIQGVTLASS
jgi:hypothetical protein